MSKDSPLEICLTAYASKTGPGARAFLWTISAMLEVPRAAVAIFGAGASLSAALRHPSIGANSGPDIHCQAVIHHFKSVAPSLARRRSLEGCRAVARRLPSERP